MDTNHSYACIDNHQCYMNRFYGGSQNTEEQREHILKRDNEQRADDKTIISQSITNVGSESHPNWSIKFTYSNSSEYSYQGGNYHG